MPDNLNLNRMDIGANRTVNLTAILYEVFGTMFLTMSIAGSGQWAANSGGAPLHMTGLVAMFTLWYLVVMLGRVSFSMLNAVVTVAFILRSQKGHFSTLRYGIPYLIAQVVGATLGSAMVLWMYGDVGPPSVPPTSTTARACLYEIFGSFTLIAMIMNVSDPDTQITDLLPLNGMMIGVALAVAVYLSSGVSGGGINPSVALGLTLVKYADSGDTEVLKDLWIYLIFPIIGGILAVVFQEFSNRKVLKAMSEKPSPEEKYTPGRGLESDR